MRLHVAVLIATLALPAYSAEDTLTEAVKTEAQRRAAADGFAGAVLVAKDGKPILQGGYGGNETDTRFRFGSMGKMFTAVAAMQLVQVGKLSLDAPISKYLPDYPNKEVAAVTIEQLLTHTGGTGNVFSPEYFERRLETREHQDYLNLFGNRGVMFAPGSRWDYSNYGMVLLGRVIEVVSGRSYYDYTHSHIFEPLGMNSTGNDPEDSRVPNLPAGQTRMGPRPGPPGPLRPNTDTLPYRGTAAGGGYSTVGDLLKFMNGLTAHRLLDAVHTKMLFTPLIATARPGSQQALGFGVRTWPEGAVSVGHGGGAPGMNGELMYFPKTGYLLVVLANQDPPVATELAEFVVRLLPN